MARATTFTVSKGAGEGVRAIEQGCVVPLTAVRERPFKHSLTVDKQSSNEEPGRNVCLHFQSAPEEIAARVQALYTLTFTALRNNPILPTSISPLPSFTSSASRSLLHHPSHNCQHERLRDCRTLLHQAHWSRDHLRSLYLAHLALRSLQAAPDLPRQYQYDGLPDNPNHRRHHHLSHLVVDPHAHWLSHRHASHYQVGPRCRDRFHSLCRLLRSLLALFTVASKNTKRSNKVSSHTKYTARSITDLHQAHV